MSTAEYSSSDEFRPATSTPSFDWRWVWLALLSSTVPMLVHYFIWNWKYEQYHFFPLLIAAVLSLFYVRFDGVYRVPRGWFAWVSVGAGTLATIASLVVDSPWLSTIGFVSFATALLASVEGRQDASLLGLAIPLVLLVRLPLGYDQLLVIWLQSITTELSSVLLDAVRVPHAVSGNVIQLASRELFVAEACSGIQSVFTLAFVALLLVALNRRPLFLAPFYFAVACVLAVAANVLRVASVAISEAWFNFDLAGGWPHEVVGYIALAIGIGLLLSFDQLFIAMVHPISDRLRLESVNPVVALWNWLIIGPDPQQSDDERIKNDGEHRSRFQRLLRGKSIRWAITSGALVLLLASTALAVMRDDVYGQGVSMFAASGAVYQPPENLFDAEVESLEILSHEVVRNGSNPRLGENADVWDCEFGGRPAQLVLSQTYLEWHEFCVCYDNGGWKLLNREVERTSTVRDSESDAETTTPKVEIPVAVALFKREDGQWGHLFYAGITATGKYVNPPELAGRLTARFMDRDSGWLEEQGGVLMCQLWITGNEKLDRQASMDLRTSFAAAMRVIAANIVAQPESTLPNPIEVE